MNTNNIEQKIEKAFDSGSANSKLVFLNETQANKFIDYVVDESVVLKNSRIVRMNRPVQTIAKLSIGDDIWQPAVRGTEMDDSKRVQATTGSIELVSKEIIAEVHISDDELQDNIEGSAFANHLLGMIAKKGANQLEKSGLYGIQTSGAVNINGLFQGAVVRAENNGIVVDASDTGLFSDRYIERVKLTKLYKSFPTKFRNILDGLYVPNDIVIDYEDLYNTNTTTAQGAENRNRYAGYSFIEAPLMDTERFVLTSGGASTTTDADVNAGETTIPVASTDDFNVGDAVRITNSDAGKTCYGTITSIDAGNSITIDKPLDYAQVSGNAVEEGTFDGADILWTPKKNLIWGIQKDIRVEPYREPRKRGTTFVLTARMDFQVENEGVLGLLTNLKVK